MFIKSSVLKPAQHLCDKPTKITCTVLLNGSSCNQAVLFSWKSLFFFLLVWWFFFFFWKTCYLLFHCGHVPFILDRETAHQWPCCNLAHAAKPCWIRPDYSKQTGTHKITTVIEYFSPPAQWASPQTLSLSVSFPWFFFLSVCLYIGKWGHRIELIFFFCGEQHLRNTRERLKTGLKPL